MKRLLQRDLLLLGITLLLFGRHTRAVVQGPNDHGSNGKTLIHGTTENNYTTSHGTDGEQSRGDHHNEEHHGEEHHDEHHIVWPSAFAMMFFIAVAGYLFYHFYSRHQMRKLAEKHHEDAAFFKECIVTTTVTGAAAPGLIAFHNDTEETPSSSKENSTKPVQESDRRTGEKTNDLKTSDNPLSRNVGGKISQESTGILGIDVTLSDNHHPPAYHDLHQH